MAKKRTLSVDVGGTGIKAIILNEAGKPLTQRSRVKTPRPATPDTVLRSIECLARTQGAFDRISIAFPGVVRKGTVYTAHNFDGDWVGFGLAAAVRKRLRKPVRVANDADIQGWAAIEGHGVELVLTLGTGLGSALFIDGTLVPNLELAHHPFLKGKTYEEKLGKAAYDQLGKKRWNRLLEQAIAELEHLFNYDKLYIGGGNTKKVRIKLPENVRIVPNVLGLLGGIALWRHT